MGERTGGGDFARSDSGGLDWSVQYAWLVGGGWGWLEWWGKVQGAKFIAIVVSDRGKCGYVVPLARAGRKGGHMSICRCLQGAAIAKSSSTSGTARQNLGSTN